MDEFFILAFLRCPSSEIVDLGIKLANLTWKENLAISMCGRNALTQEKASEQAGYSVDAMQRWYRSGINKLKLAWEGVWWIKCLSEYITK